MKTGATVDGVEDRVVTVYTVPKGKNALITNPVFRDDSDLRMFIMVVDDSKNEFYPGGECQGTSDLGAIVSFGSRK